jgi:translation initiation factor IF-2
MRELEEAIVTLSEVLEKKAPTDGVVEGWVLEASTKRSGRAATVLVRRGTLKNGDVIVAGTAWARVRSLKNEFGVVVSEAGPGTPVEVDGWRGEPGAGDEVLQAPDEDKASDVVEYRALIMERKKLADDMEAINAIRKLRQEKRRREEAAERATKLSGWDVYGEEEADAIENASTGTIEVPFIIKADVAGSTEAVVNAISAIGNNEVRSKILRSGVGAVSEFDVEHASVAEGHIIAFNTRVDPSIVQKAAQEGVKIVDQSIIYRVTEDVTRMLGEKLPDKTTQSVTGEAEIAQLFSIKVSGRKKMQIAGCKVRNGVIRLGSMVRVLRGMETVYDGKLASLKSARKDVTEMRKDTECGMGFREWEDFMVGDRVQCYEESREKRELVVPT